MKLSVKIICAFNFQIFGNYAIKRRIHLVNIQCNTIYNNTSTPKWSTLSINDIEEMLSLTLL